MCNEQIGRQNFYPYIKLFSIVRRSRRKKQTNKHVLKGATENSTGEEEDYVLKVNISSLR